jgi:hypothetical protein
LIRAQCVRADDSLVVFGKTNIRVVFEPVVERNFPRDVEFDRIRLAGRDHFPKNFPDRIAIRINSSTNGHKAKINVELSTKASPASGRLTINFLRVPKRIRQSERGKDRHHFIGPRSARLDGQPIRVPMDRELPELLEIHKRPPRNVMRRAPQIYRLFRPEEEHGRSGKNEVVPPMSCRHREMRDVRFQDRLAILHFEC